MQKQREQYTITVVGKVQEVGFRGYLADLCRTLRVPSIVYNTTSDELKLLCEADEETIKKLASGIRDYRLAEIRDLSIDKGLRLPYPTVRGVIGIEGEIFNRADEAVRMLSSIKADTQLLHSIKEDTRKLDKLDEIDSTTKRIDKKLDKLNKLDEISDTLKKISKK